MHDASKIDIDHVVPLKWAWQHGANKWTKEKRERFANDPRNLWSVELSLNSQKGAKGLAST
ncbi:MAG: HNH endonuclease family protein [Pseudomonadota bacterium]